MSSRHPGSQPSVHRLVTSPTPATRLQSLFYTSDSTRRIISRRPSSVVHKHDACFKSKLHSLFQKPFQTAIDPGGSVGATPRPVFLCNPRAPSPHAVPPCSMYLARLRKHDCKVPSEPYKRHKPTSRRPIWLLLLPAHLAGLECAQQIYSVLHQNTYAHVPSQMLTGI